MDGAAGMILQKTHPNWLEHADFRCPACGTPITEYDETLQAQDERAIHPCPACGAKLVVTREVTVCYTATRL